MTTFSYLKRKRYEPGMEKEVKKIEHPSTEPAPLGSKKPGRLEDFHVGKAWRTKDKGEGRCLEWGDHQGSSKLWWET